MKLEITTKINHGVGGRGMITWRLSNILLKKNIKKASMIKSKRTFKNTLSQMTMKTHIQHLLSALKAFLEEVYSDTDFLQETRKISNNLTYYLKEIDERKKKKNRQKEGIIKIREEIKFLLKEEKKSIKPRTGSLKKQRKLIYLWPG